MLSPYRLSLLSIILAAFAATSAVALSSAPDIHPGRFAFRGDKGKAGTQELTEAEAHAKWLMSRKPTRRTTAFRRQESEVPETAPLRPLSAVDTSSENSYGKLAYDPVMGWVISTDDSESASLTYSGSSLARRDSREAQRLTYAAKDPKEKYRYFGVGECYPGSPTKLEKGSPNVLCLVNTKSPTRAGARPIKMANNLDESGDSAVETDIWTLDYTRATAAPTWINADGSAIEATVIVAVNNTHIVYVTGDVDATSEHFGVDFRPVTLSFKDTPAKSH